MEQRPVRSCLTRYLIRVLCAVLSVGFSAPLVAQTENDDAKSLFGSGWDAFNSGRYDQCIQLFSAGLELSPNSARGHYFRGECYKALGGDADYLRAFNDFNAVLQYQKSGEERGRALTELALMTSRVETIRSAAASRAAALEQKARESNVLNNALATEHGDYSIASRYKPKDFGEFLRISRASTVGEVQLRFGLPIRISKTGDRFSGFDRPVVDQFDAGGTNLNSFFVEMDLVSLQWLRNSGNDDPKLSFLGLQKSQVRQILGTPTNPPVSDEDWLDYNVQSRGVEITFYCPSEYGEKCVGMRMTGSDTRPVDGRYVIVNY